MKISQTKCFEYGTPKDKFYLGRRQSPPINEEAVKQCMTTDAFDRATNSQEDYQELSIATSEQSFDRAEDQDSIRITYERFGHLIGEEPLPRETFTPPFSAGRR